MVGDALTDDTAERIAALGDPRIRYQPPPSAGPIRRTTGAGGSSRAPPANRALQEAAGRWIAPLDDDYALDDDHIEVLLAEAGRHPGGAGLRPAPGARGLDREDPLPRGRRVAAGLRAVHAPGCDPARRAADLRFDLNTVHAGEPGLEHGAAAVGGGHALRLPGPGRDDLLLDAGRRSGTPARAGIAAAGGCSGAQLSARGCRRGRGPRPGIRHHGTGPDPALSRSSLQHDRA